MAIAATYNAVHNREDYLDTLTIVDPQVTPFFSTLPKGKAAQNVVTYWLADRLNPADFGAKQEGVAVTPATNQSANHVTLGNIVETITKDWAVSREQQIYANPVGGSTVAEAKWKALDAMKRSLAVITGSVQPPVLDYTPAPTETPANVQSTAGTSSGARKARGLLGFLVRQGVTTTGTPNIPDSVKLPTASVAASALFGAAGTETSAPTATLSESDFNAVLASTYRASGNRGNFTLFCGDGLKSIIDNYTRFNGTSANPTVYRVNEDATTHKVTLNVTIYDGAFGNVAIVPDMWLAQQPATAGGATTGPDTNTSRYAGVLIPKGLAELAFSEAPTEITPAPIDMGQGKSGIFESMFTVRVKNPRGFGLFVAAKDDDNPTTSMPTPITAFPT